MKTQLAQVKFIFQKVLLATIIVSLFYTGLALPEELEGKVSLICTYEAKNNILKFRPIDYLFSAKTQRIDLLLGKRFVYRSSYLIAYGYLKHDNKGRNWLGTEFDIGQEILRDKISAIIVFKFFTGMNTVSRPHYYFIPALYYHLGTRGLMKVGISGYGIKIKDQESYFFLGLDAKFNLKRHIDLLLSISKNTLGSGNLIRVSTYYRF